MMIWNAKEKNTIAVIKMGTAAVFVGMISLSNAYTFTTTRRSTTSFTSFIGRNHHHKSCVPFYSQHSSPSRSFSSSSSLSVGSFSDEIPLIRIGAPKKSPDPEPEPVVSDPEPETEPETEGVEEESVQDDVDEDEPDDSEEEPAQRIVPQTQPRAVGDNGDIPLSVSIGNQQQDDIESIRSSTVTGEKQESFVTSSENIELETDEAMAMEDDDYDYEEEIASAPSEEPVVPDPEEFYGTVYSGSRSVSGTNNDVKPHFVEEIKSIVDSDVTVKEEDDSDDYEYNVEEESIGTIDNSIEEEEDTEVLAQESTVVEQDTNTVDETETEEKEQDDEDDATDPVVAEEDTIEQVKDKKEDKTEPVVAEAEETIDTDETSKEEEEESIIAEADETTTEESIVAEAEDTSKTDETESEATTSSTVEKGEDEVSTTISDLYTFAAFLDTSNKTSSDFDYDKYKYWNEVISD